MVVVVLVLVLVELVVGELDEEIIEEVDEVVVEEFDEDEVVLRVLDGEVDDWTTTAKAFTTYIVVTAAGSDCDNVIVENTVDLAS